MLEKNSCIPWASRFLRYINGKKDYRKMLKDSIYNGSYQMKTITDPGNKTKDPIIQPYPRLQTEEDLTRDDKKNFEADIDAMNAILLGIPNEIYYFVDACKTAQAMWQRVSIYGFLTACRLLIGLDRHVLKSKYPGTLLFAMGFDDDGALIPLDFRVVAEENNKNWMCFLTKLRNLLEINMENNSGLTILSDRQKSVDDGVEANFPTAFHSFCMRHILNTILDQVSNNLNFVNSASELRTELYEHYAQLDGYRIYHLVNDIIALKQQNCRIEVYYHKLKGLWDEHDALEAPYFCNCENGKNNGDKEQRKRLIQFLMGLDECYSNLR
ncbi:cysteine-rich receptor-like protein kinase 8 [Tanacetum coccineum]